MFLYDCWVGEHKNQKAKPLGNLTSSLFLYGLLA
jgi:hypothetical protein